MRIFRLTKFQLLMIGCILFGLLAICVRLTQSEIVLLTAIFLAIGFLIGLLFYQKQSYHLTDLEQISLLNEQTEESLKRLLDQMPVGVIRFDEISKEISWFNPYTELVFTTDSGQVDTLAMETFVINSLNHPSNSTFSLSGKDYTVYWDKEILYFFNVTVSEQARQRLDFQSVIGLISVDNYDEVTDDLSDAQVSQINSFVADFIAKFVQERQMFYRRLASDRFLFFTDYQMLQELIANKFDILEEFRKAAKEKELSLTLSIGASYGRGDYDQIGSLANQNLNMALMRGGDQAVVKENAEHQKVMYFGGGTASTIKRSRTRTRAMMTAISDKIRMADQVFVVGHKKLDLDALGASVGMQHFAASLLDKAYVVYDPNHLSEDIKRSLSQLENEDYQAILTIEEAMDLVTDQSLLIMVDHSKLSLTLSRELYDQFTEVIVIDHHRRDQDFPKNAILTFVESGASSACELVTELIQFQGAKKRLSKVKASLIMAGIMLDTKNFSNRVTSRTFDVASYLRNIGSDNSVIQAISATDFDEYRLVNKLILRGERLYDNIIVANGTDYITYTNVIASKAADTLLTMSGIDASFTVVKTADNQVAISARSRNQVNVQRIMEDMGGGGHFNLAACQLQDMTVTQAYNLLITTIRKHCYTKEN
ncbi:MULTISPECIES: DHH family phosphoesterase [unclassified Streptococcus]|uniref:DHH family phosphoesterase n=1 Tax=unclassified Streptococcus TaxID=2608887 RepID=UPI0011B56D0E|nr:MULTISPECIES: DHH family phosphoesterase [unclassified Streptococcus]TWS94552.1 DHH family phosphoesterase [Streptococcus sp. sy018]TWT14400.1 DHH family phosphoesterase [Streptococcus sp. sy010]